MSPPGTSHNRDIPAEVKEWEDRITKLNEKTGKFHGLKTMYDKLVPLWEDKSKDDNRTLQVKDANSKATQDEVNVLKEDIADLEARGRQEEDCKEELEDLITSRKAQNDKFKKDYEETVAIKVYFERVGKGTDKEMKELGIKMEILETKKKRWETKLQQSETELEELEDAPKQLAACRDSLKDARGRVKQQEKEIKSLKEKIDRGQKRIEGGKKFLATDQDRDQNGKKLNEAKSRLQELQEELRKQDENRLGNTITRLESELRQVKRKRDTIMSELKIICDDLHYFRTVHTDNRDRGWGKLVVVHKKLIVLRNVDVR